MQLKCLLFISFFFSSLKLSMASTFCVVVSGAKKDSNEAFKNELYVHQEQTLRGMKCPVFDSWILADAHIATLNLKAEDQLLLLQGAHGSQGGGAACNSQDVDGEQVYAYLEKYASQYKTTAVINSCFSGDLLKRKLKTDLIKGERNEMKNLCLLTSSYFNMVSYNDNDIFQQLDHKGSSTQSINSLYAYQENYLSSSAPWTSLGVSQFLSYKDIQSSQELLEHLKHHFLHNSCYEESSQLLRISQDPKVCLDLFKTVIRYIEGSDDLRKMFSKQLEMNKRQLSQLNEFAKAENKNGDQLLRYQINCLEDVNAQMSFYNGGAYSSSEDPYSFLKRVTTELKAEGRSCALYLKEHEKAHPKGQIGGYGMGGGMGIPLQPSKFKRENKGALDSPESQDKEVRPAIYQIYTRESFIDPMLDGIFFSILLPSLQSLQTDREELLKTFKDVNRDISPESVMTALNSPQTECKKSSPEQLKSLVAYLLGEEFFHQNQTYQANSKRRNNSFSPVQILKHINQLQIEDKGLHPHDKMRQKACDDFKI
jgi:hypothetical protein